MARAFIAGATGYTGRFLVDALREAGVEVVAHVRPDSPRLAEWRAQFAAQGATVDATAWDEGALRETIARLQPTHVFALLGTTRRRERAARARGETASYEAVDYGLTALLLRVVQASDPAARFIYLSALGASERGNAYLRVRGRIERELRASGLSWIAARPAFITGGDREESRPVERVAGAVIDGVLALFAALGVRRPQRMYASLTGAELARALARIALEEPDGLYDAAALREAAQPPSEGRGRRTTSPGS